MDRSGPDSDVVLATRCRLARNIAGIPFPWRADELQSKEAAQMAINAAVRSSGALSGAVLLAADRLGVDSLHHLLEWRYVSRDWALGGLHRHAIVSREGTVSLLINEEDHLRL